MKAVHFLLLLCMSYQAFTQNEASTCFFGNVGVDFRALPPQPIFPISMISKESPASICDAQGNILFYTNGGNSNLSPGIVGAVWNADHAIMENGALDDSCGCVSSFQGSIIVPFPSDDMKLNSNLYYLFTKDCIESSFSGQGYNSGLTYSVIDMNQNGGLGKVIQKKISLVPYSVATSYATAHEPVSAILHGNDTDYWLFSYTNDSLYRMRITSTGIGDLTMLLPGSGRIVISPNRDFLCSGNDVYTFNSSTGNITLFGTITSSSYSMAFSPDGSKLYNVDNYKLYQYDMTQTNFLATKTLITNMDYMYHIWLAPDHKIYLFLNSQCFKGEIRCPNQLGSACDFSWQQTCLGGGITYNDCTNLMAHYLYYSGACTATMNELIPDKREVIRIVDLMGRESADFPNTLLIYQYSDGTSEKVFRVE